MKTIRLGHEAPSHGWLTLRLVANGHSVEIDTSDVPNNPVQELISAIHSAAGGVMACVWFHLEPDGYYLHLEPIGECIRLRLDYAPESQRSRSRKIMELEGDRRDILLPFWRFIRDFQSRGYAEPHWPEVDYRDMDAIKARIDKGRALATYIC